MEYVFQLPNDGASRPVGQAAAITAAGKQVKPGGGPYTVTRDGKVVVESKMRMRVMRYLRKNVKSLRVGQTIRIRNKDEVVFWLRAVAEPQVHVINTNGNDKADEFWTWVVNEFGQYHPRNGGIYVCKDIAGSSSPSQHSYGNAVDVFFDSAYHQDIVYEAVKHGRCPVPVAHAISQKSIWEPGAGEHYYTGETHYHLHCDFSPNYSGGCGVRG